MTDEEIAEQINHASSLLAECLTINDVPHHIGMSALHSVIVSTMKANRSLAHYKDFMNKAVELTEQYWDEE